MRSASELLNNRDAETPNGEFSPFPRSGPEVALNGGRWRRTDPAYLAAWNGFL